MRQLTAVYVVAVLLSAASISGENVQLAALSASARDASWLAGVRDNIIYKPTLRSEEACGSGVACSQVIANVSWACAVDPLSGLFSARVTPRLYGAIYYYRGPMISRKRPFDRAVTDAFSANRHEYVWHIIPALRGIEPLLTALEVARFQSPAECEGVARATSENIPARFQEVLSETQREEVAAAAT